MKNRKRKNQNKKSESSDSSKEIQNSQSSQLSQKSRKRSKNYSKEETETLLKICTGYHSTISKNSNSDTDQQLKAKAWEAIKREFELHFRSQAIQVRLFMCAINIASPHCISSISIFSIFF